MLNKVSNVSIPSADVSLSGKLKWRGRIWSRLQNMAFPLRIFLLLLTVSILLVGALDRFLSHNFEQYLLDQVSKTAMNQAKIIASMDSVVNAVKHRDKTQLAQIVSRLGSTSDLDYLVIGDTQSIRLYHPNPEMIGHPMQWTKPGALERGESYIIFGKGSMGEAMRAKTPIRDEQGKIIGVVSLGYLISKIDHWRLIYLLPLTHSFILVLGVLLLLSWLFAHHIRRQMMGMEPKEIARVLRQQEALFGAVFEGLLAVDPEGRITAINQNARKMLNISATPQQLIGRKVSEVVSPDHFFLDQSGENRQDELCTFNGLNAIANRAGIWSEDGVFQGWVVSFRSQDDIHTLSAQLSQIKQYVENLRTVRHEHLNWMSTLSGLLQMKEFDRALEMVKTESSSHQALIDMLRTAFNNRQIAALLFGKYHRAKELGLNLNFVPGCQLTQLPANIGENELAAIMGNLLDNAFEASLKNPDGDKQIEIYLSDEGENVILEIADHGCGIEPKLQNSLFERGISSKNSDEHGIGLYLVATYVQQSGGTITIEENPPRGTLFTVFIPKTH
ncbi:sensor histidine kinase DpiB [Yersinia proxima]|uniref:sensor histidine kinase DpiB n=1 Tax=Yersinia proxima TaxID=2890316 RepID=UPI001D12E95F|nr:sensor histidine kinase DpiB [Yersinia proxima]